MSGLAPATDFVRLHARGRPEHPALVEANGRRAISYRELDRRVDQAVGLLCGEFQMERGDRIAALARNHVDLVVLQLACARSGAIFVPLNWRLSAVELAVLLEDCAPRLLVGDSLLDGVETDLPRLVLDALSAGIDRAIPAPPGAIDPDAPSLMLYTSGTSGRAKGVLLTEANLLATAVNFTVLGQVTPASVFLVDSPLFHVIGMVTCFRPTFMMGATSILSPGFDPATTLGRMADPSLRVSHYFCVPQMAEMLRACPGFDPESLRGLTALFTGGAPHPAARIREWLSDGIAVVDGYGMTECGTVLGMPVDVEVIDAKAGSAGLLPPTMEARIVGEDGRDLPDGVGELLLRGANVFPGYWRRPEETAQAFTEDGFFRTGDLARRDADGFHFIVDRRKDMFISGGENVYPAEIEAVLIAHPDVEEVAVVGMPDPKWGEVGHAAIVLRAGASPDETALLSYCDGRLARYKLPKAIRFLDALPRTGSGKVVKAELRRQLQDRR
ncbi:AMP-binding protein [Sphingosinicella sp. CPCC 101087]|uniref:AMP-binding protein n=1 Tax=Sphingosinicella sp. CPCC 101087 TaxID=2497754 RepID=UPI00101B8820|nr:AMP-binding protein [Sphingosinicella sp. CPCC 101087]